jgi:Flp pilus assembly protein TadB
VSPDATEKEHENLERRVEDLAGELAELINTAKASGRSDLKDLALSIVREEVRSGESEDAAEPGKIRKARPFNPIVLGVPVFVVGAMMFVFNPMMGLVLFAMASVLVAWGLATAFLFRRS